MAYKVLTDGNGSGLIRVVGLGDYVKYDDYAKLEQELATMRDKLRWRDVREELPPSEEGAKILAYKGYVFEAEYESDCGWCSIAGDNFTHWLPLPDAPK